MNQPRYAFFDFDGTLISQDSFLTLLRKGLKGAPWRIFLLLFVSPTLLLTFLLKLDKTKAKSALLWSLTFGKSKRNSVRFLRNSIASESQKIWFKEANQTFQKLRDEGIEIVIVTASGQTWVRAMLSEHKLQFRTIIGTRLTFFAGGVVLNSKNCYQEEKINRIHEALGKDFIWHSAWSDHIADLPMLVRSNKRYIICPKDKHLSIFTKELNKNYTLLKWNC
ncbi:HAD family hydrolase [Fluviispira multicolorata]|uniref:HAD-IB family phosphatase n=1 Tax=Fluviispira multicolorata TaxID=2654512 RepID=A0A833JFM3_9BACT|nr:HAD family hydrolase [Fluviispira multicolorata]KAB8033380.1 HAD-IB family phosphatase [Fluviispira multicolorata]